MELSKSQFKRLAYQQGWRNNYLAKGWFNLNIKNGDVLTEDELKKILVKQLKEKLVGEVHKSGNS